MALGKDDVLSRELLLGMTMSATGAGTIGLLTMHGCKVLVRRTSLRVFQRFVSLFAGKVTQQLVKSMIAKWLPFLGAGAMAAWTRYTTVAVGRRARDLLSLPVAYDPEPGEAPDTIDAEVVVVAPDAVMRNRILLLANLVHVDGEAAPTEQAYLDAILANSGLGADLVADLTARVALPQQQVVDYAVFTDRDEAMGVLMDLVALAYRDGALHPAERAFIRQAARQLRVGEVEVDALLQDLGS